MKFILIKKNGSVVQKDMINDDNDAVKVIKNISEHLSAEVEFEDGLTFGTLFNLILQEKSFFNTLFKQELKELTLEDFEAQLKKEPTNNHTKNKYGDILFSLEIAKMFEFFKFDKGQSINLFALFVGVGTNNDEDDEDEIYMPLSLIPINEFKNYEIVINKAVEIFKKDFSEDSITPLLIAGTSITLYEALHCLIYEIAFFGTAENKIKEKKEQSKNGEEYRIKDKIIELDAYLKKLVLEENYEKASIIKKELDKLKTKNKSKNAER